MKADLSSTSALVLLWVQGEIHTSTFAQKFLDMLNLDSGKKILEQCKNFWPHYSEILKNRKSCILDLVKANILKNKIEQIVILGAGFDALSLEILSHAKNCKIFEIDIKNMDVKQNLIRRVHPSLVNSIDCITLDLSTPENMMPNLLMRGWRKNIPSLIIIEGLSYYLSKDQLRTIIGEFKTKNCDNHVILEYLLPADKISNKWVEIAEYPFMLISNDANLSFITRYSIDDILAYFTKSNSQLLCHYEMNKMEKERTSQNTLFDKQTGWIEICEILV